MDVDTTDWRAPYRALLVGDCRMIDLWGTGFTLVGTPDETTATQNAFRAAGLSGFGSSLGQSVSFLNNTERWEARVRWQLPDPEAA